MPWVSIAYSLSAEPGQPKQSRSSLLIAFSLESPPELHGSCGRRSAVKRSHFTSPAGFLQLKPEDVLSSVRIHSHSCKRSSFPCIQQETSGQISLACNPAHGFLRRELLGPSAQGGGGPAPAFEVPTISHPFHHRVKRVLVMFCFHPSSTGTAARFSQLSQLSGHLHG